MKYFSVLAIAGVTTAQIAEIADINIQPNFGQDWGYEFTTATIGVGPDAIVTLAQPFDAQAWPAVFPEDCAVIAENAAQSPIALEQSIVTHALHCRSLDIDSPLLEDDELIVNNVTNVGYTIQVQVNNSFDFPLNGVPQARFLDARANQDCDSGTFLLDTLNFRFGAQSEDRPGSEHTIEGKSGVLETQALYFRSDLESFFTPSINATDGTPVNLTEIEVLNSRLIVSTLFEIGEPNVAIQALVDSLNQDPLDLNESRDIEFNPRDLIGDDASPYFLYNGTLTIPTCTGGVRYMVLAQKLTVSEEQLETLRAQSSGVANDRSIAPNLRELQSSMNATIYANRFLLTEDYKLNVLPSWIVSGLFLGFLIFLLVRWAIITKHKNDDH
eukprot:Awhi_evm1s5270